MATLEERTRPKRSTPTDFVKEWAGVGTLLIALLYTFPLGVWDRFFVTAEQKRAQQVDMLRDLAIHVSELDATYAQSYNSIADEQLRAFFSRAMSSQKAALIERYLPVLQKHYAELSTPEMIVLGYNVGLAGKAELADQIYTASLKKAQSDKSISLEADIYRLRAQLFSSGPQGVDLLQMRSNYSRAIEVLLRYSSPGFRLQASNSAFEWAVLELSAGDWMCGQALGAWAIATVGSLPPTNPEVYTYGTQYRNMLGRFALQASQSQVGCPEELTPWLSASK